MSVSFLALVAATAVLVAVLVTLMQHRLGLTAKCEHPIQEQHRQASGRALSMAVIFITLGLFRAGTLLWRGALNDDVFVEFGLTAVVICFGIYQGVVCRRRIKDLQNTGD